ncbi:MAG TPA: hypothetical protein VN947_09160 [Polyangia bacterium]|nr:hypothetical protein [Polyangia bacterium]
MTEEATSLDRWTIAAIAALAWPLADMLHEGGGHGGTALLLGVKASALTSAYYQYADGAATVQQARLIAAGGAVLNVIVGLPMVALSRARLPSRLRFFVWLFAAYNLLTAFGYLCYSGVAGIGDFAAVIDGVPHAHLWRVVEIVAGVLLYFVAAPALLWPGLRPFVGAGADREARARTLTLVPYLAGGVTSVLSGALNPLGVRIMLISSVAAAFGGTSLLAWYFPVRAERQPAGAPPALGIARGNGWLVAAAIAVAVFIGVFGRGLRF